MIKRNKIETKQSENKRAPGINRFQFDRIFEEYYDQIKNNIYYKTGNVLVAEDILQETFLKLWEKRNSVKIDTVGALLYKIANNLLLNVHKHNQVVFKFTNSFTKHEYAESPEFKMELKEFDERLQQAIAGLSEKNREVFLMNRIDKFTYKEIAEKLDISVKTVEKRMSNSLSFVKKKIGVNV